MINSLPFTKKFFHFLEKNNYSKETIYNYKRDLQTFDRFLCKKRLSFRKITKQIIEEYKHYLTSEKRKTAKNQNALKKLSKVSINRMLSSIRCYLKYLDDNNYNSPLSHEVIKLVKYNKKTSHHIRLKDQLKLVEAPTLFEKKKKIALRNRAMLEVVFSTGVRISELINIKKDEIDKTGRIFIKGKGKKERFVYLTPRAQKHIKKYLEVRGKTDSPYLFIPFQGKNIHKKNKKISPNYLQAKIKRYRELLGLNIPISCHSIRHAFATYLAESGASPAAIQILLGHESLDTTTRYVHASDRYAERIFRKFHPLKE